jgi:hypothetical protein
MKRVGESRWYLSYAARGANWGLAGYYLRRVNKLENALKVLRRKHRERLERFQNTALPPVIEAVAAEDIAQIEAAYAAANWPTGGAMRTFMLRRGRRGAS